MNLIVLRVGELFLKGGNRYQFEELLEANVRRALQRVFRDDGYRVLAASGGEEGNRE